jgi:hypothetical protein
VTTVVPILPDSPQLEVCVTFSDWPDIESNFFLAKFGPLLAQDLEFFSSMAFDLSR